MPASRRHPPPLNRTRHADQRLPAEFRERSRQFWLFGTGAGAALFAGALLGVIVGTVIVAQTLYSSTKDHLNEFATLRAIGSSRKYIYKVIICQALLSAVMEVAPEPPFPPFRVAPKFFAVSGMANAGSVPQTSGNFTPG